MAQLLNKKFPPLLQTTPLTDESRRVSRPWLDQFTKFSQAQFLAVTNAQRLAPNAKVPEDGSLAFETDTGIFYVASGGVWQYLSGTRFVLANNVLTLGLLASDSGYELYVADLAHYLIWNGTGFQWGSGENSGFIEQFVTAPNPATGWQVCDGTANVTRLNGDGTITFETVPATGAPNYYRQ